MNKSRTLPALFLLLVALGGCGGPLPGQNGGSQHPAPVYTITSLPPFPTATGTATVTATTTSTATRLPSPTASITSSPVPTFTQVGAATVAAAPAGSQTPAAADRPVAPVVARFLYDPPVLDGDWSEWKSLTDEYPANIPVWGKEKWDGPEDLSASFHLGWDYNCLYLAIKVRDEHYVQNAHGANLFNGDSLELLLDTRLKEDYGSAMLSDDDFQLGLSAGRPTIGVDQEAYLWTPYHLKGLQKNIQIEARRESGLYRVEAKIPWIVFEMRPVAGEHYGFALSVSDNDDGDGGVQQSMVSNLPVRYPGDPSTWGDLQLVK